MNIKTQRAKALDAFISANASSQGAPWPIVIGGERKSLPVLRVPIQLLRYNIGNGRFAVEKLILQQELGRELDYERPDDIVKIRTMLLEEDGDLSDKARSLIEDLKRVGQLEPGIITNDGFVINGNRRMAAFEYLHAQEPTGKWQYLEVQRLPPSIGAKDLWRIEAGLQLSKEKKEEYGPMNELLKIREGREAGLSENEIAAAMFEWSPKEVADAIERLELIDTFLEFVAEKDRGGYGLIEKFGLHEYFIDLQKNVYKPARKEKLPTRELSKRLNYSFALIWAAVKLPEGKKEDRITHWDIRDLKKVFDDFDATYLFTKNLKVGRNPKSLKADEIRDDFRAAQELLDFKKGSQQPRRLIETATRALRNIDRGSPTFTKEQLAGVVKELDGEVARLKKDLAL